jgi:hypothetical protein
MYGNGATQELSNDSTFYKCRSPSATLSHKWAVGLQTFLLSICSGDSSVQLVTPQSGLAGRSGKRVKR